MGGNGMFRRWRISLHRSPAKGPPSEFICPISNSLMADPVVVASGETFERICVNVCKDLGFTPTISGGSPPDFSAVIPNLALKTSILSWCSKNGMELAHPPLYGDIESLVRSQMAASEDLESPKIRVSERDLLKGMREAPPKFFSHAATELNPRNLYSSSSSEESVVANTTPLLPFATRPSCFSSSSSPSTSSEFVADETTTFSVSSSSGEDESFVNRMRSLDVYEQEQGVILLRKTTRDNEETRAALCSERLLFALKPLLRSQYPAVQINSTAAVVNLSLEKCNKIKIVRAGLVPLLIEKLKNGFEESREHAAGAIFSLSLEDDNKTPLGVLGALPPLLHVLRSGTRRSRQDAALALYHLTLVQSNRVKVVKLGAAGVLLSLLKDAEVAARVVLVVCNLAASDEGRAALLDARAVECFVGLLRDKPDSVSESTRENCVAALQSLSHGSLRFKGLARDSGAVEVMLEVAETGSERAREKAKRVLEVLKGPEAMEEGDEVDWEAVMTGGVTRARYRVGKSNGPNSTEF